MLLVHNTLRLIDILIFHSLLYLQLLVKGHWTPTLLKRWQKKSEASDETAEILRNAIQELRHIECKLCMCFKRIADNAEPKVDLYIHTYRAHAEFSQ